MPLASAFDRSKAEHRAAFIPYVMAGDPDVETTLAVVEALARLGADAIELGIPYGDPLADGPTIAAAGQRALEGGVGINDVLALVASLRARACSVPVVLFTYFNPIYKYGLERFANEAHGAGAGAAIVPDIALEETESLRSILEERQMAMPLLVAPSTSRERAARIAQCASGFVYVVSRLGVTGAGSTPDFMPLREQVAKLREVTAKPLAVGFGVSRAEHVREVAPLADGIIVGSALIDAYAGTRGDEAAARVATFVEPLMAAAKRF